MEESGKKRGDTDLREKVVRYLNGLRIRYGLPECSYLIPLDGPEKRGRPDYLPFVWAEPVASILEAASQYVREQKERLAFSED